MSMEVGDGCVHGLSMAMGLSMGVGMSMGVVVTLRQMARSVIAPPKTKMVKEAMSRVVCRIASESDMPSQ